MANFTPQLGAKGLYTLMEPFQHKLLSGVLYEPIAIRSIADIVSDGGDPYTDYYLPGQISQEKYQEDVNNNVLIVTFQADQGNVARIPTSYISGQPDVGGVPYRTMLLAAYLAPIPDSLDLSFLETRMGDLVFDTLGIRAEIRAVVASPPSILTQVEHEAIEAARQVVIANNETDYAKYLRAQRELDEARTRIEQLESYILNPPAP